MTEKTLFKKSYTVKIKLELLREYAENKTDGSRKSKSEICEKYGISNHMINDWLSKENEFLAVLNYPIKTIKTVRRVGNLGRSTPFQDLEIKLKYWLLDNNNKGLIVKDKYLQS
ncbi:hypothetical protein DMUE_1660 [Dictyocoela muelleri]|nr:hypothetical protein DMUE_1660 [Dictyocoela muelleri]